MLPRTLLAAFPLLLLGAAGAPSGSSEPAHVPSTNPAYTELVQAIEGRGRFSAPARNLEELLPRLSAELRSNFTLVYESRSPHAHMEAPALSAVDPMHPRVVLFTKDARLLVAFTGHPQRPGYGVVEAIHFDDDRRAFVTSQFVLPDAARADPAMARLARQNGRQNRQQCLQCHGADPRPIFDSYNVWPGFYGSLADEPGLHPRERTLYPEFLRTQRGRKDLPYRYLTFKPRDKRLPSAVYPFMPSNGHTPAPLARPEELNLLPNTRLGMALTELNRQRIFRQMKRSPHYQARKYALLSGLAGCTQMPISKAFEARVLELTERENAAKLRLAGVEPTSRLGKLLAMQELNVDLKRGLAEILYVAEALSISRPGGLPEDWSMAFEPGAVSYFDGILSGIVHEKSYYLKEDLIHEMIQDLASEDEAFVPFDGTYNSYADAGFSFGNRMDTLLIVNNKKFCALLKDRSEHLGPLGLGLPSSSELPEAIPGTPAKKSSIGNPFAICVSCHEPSAAKTSSLAIPFGDLTALREALAAPSPVTGKMLYAEVLDRIQPGSRRRMPMASAPLKPRQREAIEDWVRAAGF